MNSYLLQDWVTIRDAKTGPTNFAQASAMWLDLGHAAELALFLEVPWLTSSFATTLRFDTSPYREAALFQEMSQVVLAASPTPVVTRIALYDNPTVAVARWLRWRITTPDTSALEVTFRISVMAYRR